MCFVNRKQWIKENGAIEHVSEPNRRIGRTQEHQQRTEFKKAITFDLERVTRPIIYRFVSTRGDLVN